MALTGAQHGRHNREWADACRVQGWDPKDNARRLAFYAVHKLPASRADWHPKTHFDTFLDAVAPLRNRIDIRDRDRESEEFVIEQFGQAIAEATGGGTYVKAIREDLHDQQEPYDIPLDPIPDQREQGRVARIEETKYGSRNVYRADLNNLKITLRNRLSRLLTRIKKGEGACPAGREWWTWSANNDVISAIARNKICVRVRVPGTSHTVPHFITPAEYARLHRAGRAGSPQPAEDSTPAAPLQEPCDPAAAPELFPEPPVTGRRGIMRAPIPELAPVPLPGHESEDDYIPF